MSKNGGVRCDGSDLPCSFGRKLRQELREAARLRLGHGPKGSPYLEPVQTVWAYDDDANTVTITETKSGSDGTKTDVTVNTLDRTFDRLTTSVQRGVAINYQYDANGNRLRVESPGGVTAYRYDERNRIEFVDAGTETVEYKYFPDGRREQLIYPNGVTTTLTYFDTLRVQSITSVGGGQDMVGFAYTYDANGNRKTQAEVRGSDAELTTFDTYDRIDRLKQYTVGTQTTSYTFAGYNRFTEKVVENGTTEHDRVYQYDDANRLNHIADQGSGGQYAIDYQYDNNGNTLEKTKTNEPGAATHLRYNSRDQLVEAARGPPGSVETIGQYDYNADGQRVRHRASGHGDIDYYHDGTAVLEERNAADSTVRSRYHYAERALRFDDFEVGTSQYYHHDALGTTTHLTPSDLSPAGTPTPTYKVDPWGRPRAGTNVSASNNRKLYTGHEYDDRTGYYYANARYYDPDTGRFLTQDTYLGKPGVPPSLHRYLYAYGNPARYTDPTGHYAACEGVDCMESEEQILARIESGEKSPLENANVHEDDVEEINAHKKKAIADTAAKATVEDKSGREEVDTSGDASQQATNVDRGAGDAARHGFEGGWSDFNRIASLREPGFFGLSEADVAYNLEQTSAYAEGKDVADAKAACGLTCEKHPDAFTAGKWSGFSAGALFTAGVAYVQARVMSKAANATGAPSPARAPPLVTSPTGSPRPSLDAGRLAALKALSGDANPIVSGSRSALASASTDAAAFEARAQAALAGRQLPAGAEPILAQDAAPKAPPSRGYDRPEIETKSGSAIKDPIKRWNEFLGPKQTGIDPRDGLPDPDRIWSADGQRSIRFGSHEMNSPPNKFHYHEETWEATHVENVLQRVPQKK